MSGIEVVGLLMAIPVIATGIAVGGAAMLFGNRRVESKASQLKRSLLGKPQGLTIVYSDPDPQVDIVFVHGLAGHLRETWTALEGTQKVNWMEDLLPRDIGRSRILTFGYSETLFLNQTFGVSNKNSQSANLMPIDDKILQYTSQALYLHSKTLLEELTRARGEVARDRPIIFIAHSLGGLIVKGSLVQASAAIGEHCLNKAVQLCTVGILFFGTPHQETPETSWSKLITDILSVSLRLPTSKYRESPPAQSELFDLQVQRYKSIQNNFENYSFSEKKKTKIGDGLSRLVVPESSAVLVPMHPSERGHNISLQRSHQGLVKFTIADDHDYQFVLKCIRGCLAPKNMKAASARCSIFFEDLFSPGRKNLATNQNNEPDPIKDPRVINSIVRINSWDKKERHKKAEITLKEELSRSERENGPSDTSTLELVKRLAQYHVEAEEYSKAEFLYKRLFVATQDRYGPWSLKTAEVLQQISEVGSKQSHFAEATECMLCVERIQEAALPFDDLGALSTRASIAILYDKQQRWPEAEKLYPRVIKAREARLGESHEETLMVMENLALHYRIRGRKTLQQAAEQYQIVLSRRKENLEEAGVERKDEARAHLIATVQKLAGVYMELRDNKRRKKLLEEWPFDDSGVGYEVYEAGSGQTHSTASC